MSALAKLLDGFHTSILTGDAAPAASSIRGNLRLTPAEQLAIYIDGYRIRLTQAIRADYPALLALLGDEAFDSVALGYIESHPPEGFNLDRYPHHFSVFVSGHSDDQFANDIAVLEGAIAEVFIMPESEPLDPPALANLTEEDFGNFVLKLRNASKLLVFNYKVDNWLTAHRGGIIPLAPEKKEATFLYVYRHQNNVQRVALTEAAYHVLKRLGRGLPVGQALDIPEYADTITENLQTWFAEWIARGFFKA